MTALLYETHRSHEDFEMSDTMQEYEIQTSKCQTALEIKRLDHLVISMNAFPTLRLTLLKLFPTKLLLK